MTTRRDFLRGLGAAAGTAAVTACGGGSRDDATPTPGPTASPTPTPGPTPTATPPPPLGFDFPTITPLPFAHGVASGDPLKDRVIIWTRITEATPSAAPNAAEIPVQWAVATDPAMANVIQSGTQGTNAERDWTVKVDVTGLSSATTYYYRFSALGGTSITGRTRTAPDGEVESIRVAVLACSSYWSSWWSGLGHLAQRNDLDLVIHTGDYIYDFVDEDEEVRGRNGIQDTAHPDYRDWLNLAELRRRYALWRTDPNNLRAHQQHPWFIVWDNHDIDEDYGNELATPFDDQTSSTTLADTTRAYWEWTPSRPVKADGSGEFILVDDGSYPAPQDTTLLWRRLPYGPMLEVYGVDTQIGLPGHGLTMDRSHLASGSSLMGRPQFEWLTQSMLQSQQAGVRWKLINNQTWIAPADIPDVVDGVPTPKLGLSRWSDYAEERAALFQHLRGENAAATRVRNAIVVSGDAHGNFGSDLVEDTALLSDYIPGAPVPNPRTGSTTANFPAGYGRATTGAIGPVSTRAASVGVEFAPSSMGRGGADELVANSAGLPVGSAPTLIGARAIEAALIDGNKNCQFIEWVDHGYGIVHLAADRAVFEYWWQDKLTPDAPDVLGRQMIAWAAEDAAAVPPRFPDQLDDVVAHGMLVTPTSGTRTAEPAPEGVLVPT